jgi:lincosamide nucleotidyltransferase A/C/D/E
MRAGVVIEMLQRLADEDVDVWIGGGWGIDALLGRQRRDHGDLDVSVRVEHLDVVLDVLDDRGFEIVADRLPTRIVLRHRELGDVDVHPIRFEPDGSAWLPDPTGGRFTYPAGSFTSGTIMGVTVPCIDASLQSSFHLGYQPLPKDRDDMQALAEAGLIDLPEEYA